MIYTWKSPETYYVSGLFLNIQNTLQYKNS